MDKLNNNREKIPANKAVKELSLLLMYLTRYNSQDRFSGEENISWKGYSFKILDELEEEELINQGSHRPKSVHIHEEGLKYQKQKGLNLWNREYIFYSAKKRGKMILFISVRRKMFRTD